MSNPQLIKKPVFYHAVVYFSCLEIKKQDMLANEKNLFIGLNFLN